MTDIQREHKPILMTIFLGILGLFNGYLGAGLLFDSGRVLILPDRFSTIAHLFAFGQSSGVVIGLIVAGFMALSLLYSPSGSMVDRSHIWVSARSGKKTGNATVKQVYEKKHGRGSWEKKVERERYVLAGFLGIVALGLSIYGVSYLLNEVELEILREARALFPTTFLFAAGWFVSGLIGCLSLVAIYLFVFWDYLTVLTGFSLPAQGAPQFKYDSPPDSTVIPRLVLVGLILLLQGYILAYSLFPGLKTSAMGGMFSAALPLVYGLSAGLWFLGALIPGPELSASYRRKKERKQEQKMKKSMMESSLENLFGKNAGIHMRYVSALFLLEERESLTGQGKKEVVRALKVISGEDFGTDYAAWTRWIRDHIDWDAVEY